MLRLTLFIWSLFVVPVSAYAATCSSSILPDSTQSRVGRVACSRCSSVADFARYGAAVLQDNRTSSGARYNLVVVSNPRGSSVEVDINSLTIGTGIYIGYGIFSSELRQRNSARLGVTATPRTSGVSGSPWNNQPTLVSELTKVCKALKLEKEAKENAQKQQSRQSSPTFSTPRVGFGSRHGLASFYLRNSFDSAGQRATRSVPVVKSYSCGNTCGSSSPKWVEGRLVGSTSSSGRLQRWRRLRSPV